MSAPLHLTIATRGSNLALLQAGMVKTALEQRHGAAISVDLLIVKTKGDLILDRPLAKVGGKGLFVKEIEEAVLDGRADLAVHSMKDVPMCLADGLCLGVIMERGDPRDVFLSEKYARLDALPPGSRLGTSSLRRQAQALALRPDLQVASLRGNVETRLRKLGEGQFEAIIMAQAGLERLGVSAPCQDIFAANAFLPAVGQGALGIEFRSDRADLHNLLAFLEHPATRLCVEAERGLLAGLDGSCQTPLAGYARLETPQTIRLQGLVGAIDGSKILRRELVGTVDTPRELGLTLARQLLEAGAAELIRTETGGENPAVTGGENPKGLAP